MNLATTWGVSVERDVVRFCERRRNQRDVDTIIAQTNFLHLADDLDINNLLENGNYIPVLKWIWSNENTSELLSWLRRKKNEYHAILLYEQAIAEFSAKPTTKTLHFVSIPLIKAASFRVLQDCTCLKGSKEFIATVVDRMELSYITCLKNLLENHLQYNNKYSHKGLEKKRNTQIKKALLKIAEHTLTIQPLKNNWLIWYNKDDSSLHPKPIPIEEDGKLRMDKIARRLIRVIAP